MKLKIYRKAHFNAAHRLHNPDWTQEKNDEIFGKCNNPNWHGHNYVLTAEVTGELDPATGYVIDIKILKEIIQEEIEERFDHRNLNLDVEEMKGLNPTAENIAVVCWNLIRKRLEPKYELKIRLHETERNFVEYDGNI